jgi:hypothetical protein
VFQAGGGSGVVLQKPFIQTRKLFGAGNFVAEFLSVDVAGSLKTSFCLSRRFKALPDFQAESFRLSLVSLRFTIFSGFLYVAR